MARIKQPQLPAGALSDFFVALHNLHLKAGYPSTREIQKDIGRNVVSHTTIHKALSGPNLPGWGIVELLVEALAKRSRQNPDTTIEYTRSLWEDAAKSLQDSPETDTDRVQRATLAVRETIQHRATRPFADLMLGTLDEIEAIAMSSGGLGHGGRTVTGFADFDALTSGLRPGSLTVVASRPSIGKSTLLITICAGAAINHAIPCAIFSSEMTERDIQMRILSAQARVSYHSMQGGMMAEDDWERLARKMAEIIDAPLSLSYSPKLSIEELRNETRTLSEEGRLKFLGVDSVDTLVDRAHDPREILYDLKQLAADLHVPILITVPIGKPGMHTKPSIADLWYAESIETIADILIMLDRPDAYDSNSPRVGELDLIFVKHRYGPVATLTLWFQGHYCRIVDLFISEERRVDWPTASGDQLPESD